MCRPHLVPAARGRTGWKERAEWEVAEVWVASPSLTLARLAFSFPFRNPRTLEATLGALRAAGVPDRQEPLPSQHPHSHSSSS